VLDYKVPVAGQMLHIIAGLFSIPPLLIATAPQATSANSTLSLTFELSFTPVHSHVVSSHDSMIVFII
jgi:hypothetical protein